MIFIYEAFQVLFLKSQKNAPFPTELHYQGMGGWGKLYIDNFNFLCLVCVNHGVIAPILRFWWKCNATHIAGSDNSKFSHSWPRRA